MYYKLCALSSMLVAMLLLTACTVNAQTETGQPLGSNNCPTNNFLDVQAHPLNSAYPAPQLSVSCSGDTMTVNSNNIPTFEFVQITPNALAAQSNSYQIPLNPTPRAVPGAMPLGTVGVSVTGLNLFGAFEAPQQGYADPVSDNILDSCNGHTARQGDYHFHARFGCIFSAPDTVGLVYGYLFDGYEIVAPYECADAACSQVRKVRSSYVRVNQNSNGAFDAWQYQQGAGDLDICNGRTDADGQYRYYATDEFPYLPFCFYGESARATSDFTGNPPTGGTGGGRPAQGQLNQQAVGQQGQQGQQQAQQPFGNRPPRPQQGAVGGPPPGGPDLSQAAAALGITVQELIAALGPPGPQGPDFVSAAARLGISADRLRQVMPPPPRR